MGAATACAGTPPIANAGAACADVRAHRTRETAPGWVDTPFGRPANAARLISSDALVQRCFRGKARKIHFVSSSEKHFVHYCGKFPTWVLQQKQGLQGIPVGTHPGGHRHHHDHSAVPPRICCGITAVPRELRARFVADRYCVLTARSEFSALNPGSFIISLLRRLPLLSMARPPDSKF
jgi:hypothetical protein